MIPPKYIDNRLREPEQRAVLEAVANEIAFAKKNNPKDIRAIRILEDAHQILEDNLEDFITLYIERVGRDEE